jgi:hypothetical protein
VVRRKELEFSYSNTHQNSSGRTVGRIDFVAEENISRDKRRRVKGGRDLERRVGTCMKLENWALLLAIVRCINLALLVCRDRLQNALKSLLAAF